MPSQILIVEDNQTNLELMVYLIEAFGYNTVTASNGEIALETMRLTRPDLIVCDLEMPVMGGYELVRRIRSDSNYRDVRIVAVSAYAMVGDREKILSCGFDGYISKPIDPEKFVKQLEVYLPRILHSGRLPVTAEAASPDGEKPASRGRVLVVDDSPTNLSLLRSTLEPSGYEVFAAARVDQAHKLARQCRPDLILCDVHMSPADGLEFLRLAKDDSELRDVPFLMCSASFPSHAEQALSLQLGAVRCISRPIEPESLLAEVEGCLRAARDRKGKK